MVIMPGGLTKYPGRETVYEKTLKRPVQVKPMGSEGKGSSTLPFDLTTPIREWARDDGTMQWR